MRVFYGIVKPERCIFTALAVPQLTAVEELSGDWGDIACSGDVLYLADQILGMVVNTNIGAIQTFTFAEDVLRKIETNKTWMITEDAVKEWFKQPKVVIPRLQ